MAYLECNRLLEFFAYLGFTYYAAGGHVNSITSGIDLNGFDQLFGSSSSFVDPDETNLFERHSNFENKSSICNSSLGTGRQLNNQTWMIDNAMHCANETLFKAIIITTDKRLDNIRRFTQRTVFYCRVYGDRKVGKVSVVLFFLFIYVI